MKIGMYLTTAVAPGMTQREVIEDSLYYAQCAERMGFESVWVLEHHFTKYGICSSTITMASYLLGMTKKLKVGTAINIVPIEHPVRLAEQVALLDQLSDGRFMLGIGRGLFDRDFDVFGTDIQKSRAITDIWVKIMRRAWREGKAEGDGEFLNFREVLIYPETYTKPEPQCFVAAMSPTTVEWAARQGLPMLIQHDVEDEEKLANIELYRQIATECGHDVSKIEHTLSFGVVIATDTDSLNTLKERSRNYLTWWSEEGQRDSKIFDVVEEMNVNDYSWHLNKWKEAVRKGERDMIPRTEKLFRLNPVGTPDECIRKINETVALTGVKRIILSFETVGNREDIRKNIALFEERVLPHIEGYAKVPSTLC